PVYANDGYWSVGEVDSLSIRINGKEAYDRWICDKDIITVTSLDGKTQAIIYAQECDENYTVDFDKYSVENIDKITIGSFAENTIVYNGPRVASNHAVIEFQSETALVKLLNDSDYLYVNGVKTTEKTLSWGDIINIMGLKIIFMGDFIAVKSPKTLLKCSLPLYEPDNEKLFEEVFAGESPRQVYFQRSPRIIKKLDQGQIEIDSPPTPNTQKEQPLILSIGPSFTMGMGMLVSLMFTINASRNNPVMVIPGVVMTGCMLAGTILWPILSRSYQKRTKKKEEKKRVKRYREYMQKVFSKLEERIDRNNKILAAGYPEPAVLINRAVNKDRGFGSVCLQIKISWR
ncbi:MAG TPA: FHA domain-containing protein, partial [Acetivibrio saccincola]|nr:FHA domain-containing protein [Acetivibrio saccincola]